MTPRGSFALVALAVGVITMAAFKISYWEPIPMTEQQCEARPRLYDTDRAAYWRLARQVFARDGAPWERRHEYQLNHKIPWCLCGTDDPRNLEAEPRQRADARDDRERLICGKVRGGKMTLDEGRQFFGDGGERK